MSLLVFLAIWCVSSFGADDGRAKSQEGAPFIVAPSTEEPRVYFALTAWRRYSFVPPRGWNASTMVNEKEVLLQDPARTCRIRIRFRDEPGAGGSREGWMSEIAAVIPGATFEQQPPVTVLEEEAAVIDASSESGESILRQGGRFVRIDGDNGALEFSLLCGASDFERFLPLFMQCVNSFRGGPVSERLPARIFRAE
jgi:hypothetical protein